MGILDTLKGLLTPKEYRKEVKDVTSGKFQSTLLHGE